MKVWSSRSGELLATLRGHCGEISDISLSVDNTLLASGSLDKTVRVWCLQTSAPVAVLSGHQGGITSVQVAAGCTCVGVLPLLCCPCSSLPHQRRSRGRLAGRREGGRAACCQCSWLDTLTPLTRYLASTSKDGFVCFWQWQAGTHSFE